MTTQGKELAQKVAIKNQASQDLKNYSSEQNISLNLLLKDIEKNSTITLRSLQRITGKSNSFPSNDTLIAIYSYFYKTKSLIELLKKVPEVIETSIKSEFIFHDKGILSTAYESEIFQQTKDQIFCKIYFMTSGDYGESLETIRDEFGNHGEVILGKLLQMGIIKLTEDDRVIRAVTICLSARIKKNLSKAIAEIYDPIKNEQPGKNFSSIFMGDVTEEDFDKIYEISRDSSNRIGEIIKKSKPTISNYKKITISTLMEEINSKSEMDKE